MGRLAYLFIAGVFLSSSYAFAESANDYCDLYPITLPLHEVQGLVAGQRLVKLPLGNGEGNYSWLSWSGDNDANTLSASLARPGNSALYVDPTGEGKTSIDVDSWVQGAPGVKNGKSVRDALDALISQSGQTVEGSLIVLPVWDKAEGNGSQRNYHIATFAQVTIDEYVLNGKGWMTFTFHKLYDCNNKAPEITSSAVEHVSEGQLYQYAVEAIDPDAGDILVYALTESPEAMTINASTGDIQWLTDYDDAGEHAVSIRVTDASGSSAEQRFTLTVSNVNRNPVFQFSPTVQGKEGEPYSVPAVAIDPDGDPLTFHLTQSPTGMQIDSASGVISWVPDFTQAGEHAVTLEVRDLPGGKATMGFTVVVSDTNRPPVTEALAVNIAEDSSAFITLHATDADSDQLSFLIITYPMRGTLEGVGAHYKYTPSANANGVDEFSFIATDGKSTSNTSVVQVNIAARNDSPTFSFNPSLTAEEGIEYTASVKADDIEGDPLTYSLLDAPQGMTIDPVSGLINWLPGFDDAGTHDITIQVDDSHGGIASTTFTVVVTNTNRGPEIISAAPGVADVGAPFVYQVVAQDPDQDALTFELDQAPDGAQLDAASGVLSWIPGADQVGEQFFAVRVVDGPGQYAVQSFFVTVNQQNSAPRFTSMPIYGAVEGTSYRYELKAEDPDSHALSYALEVAPAGMQLSPAGNTLIWATPVSGRYPVEVTVTDAPGLADKQSFTLSVVTEQPPVTTKGEEFWLMFNASLNSPTSNSYIYLSSEQPASVTVSVPSQGISQQVSIDESGVSLIDMNLLLPEWFYNEVGIVPWAIHLAANADINAFIVAGAQHSRDSSLVLPVESLGTEYVVLSDAELARGNPGSPINRGNFVGIVATADDTQVTITPKVPLEIGSDVWIPANEPYQVILNRGQAFQAKAKAGRWKYVDGEVSGSRVSANKPIAVFGGDECIALKNSTACDHIVEQVLPIQSWGAEFYVMPLAGRKKGDTFKLYSASDNNHVWVNDTFIAQLNEGEYHDLDILEPSIIRSTRPLAVMQFANSENYDPVVDANGVVYKDFGDPFMLTVPPKEQYLSSYIVSTPEQLFALNFINLIAPRDSLDTVYVDGSQVNEDAWVAIPGTSYSGAQISVASGTHQVTGDHPFGMYIYGYNVWESYGHLGGMALTGELAPNKLDVQADNLAPVIGQLICVRAQVLDSEDQPLAQAQVEFVRTFSGASRFATTLTDVTGMAKFCYTAESAGIEPLRVSAGELSTTLSVAWAHKNDGENTAPQFFTLPVTSATPAGEYQYAVVARDANDDPLVYSLAQAPQGMTIDSTSGVINWSVPGSFVSAPVLIHVTDGVSISEQAYTLRFTQRSNHVPEIVTQPVTRAITGRDYVYQVRADDYNMHSWDIDYQLIDSPAGMVISGQNIRWPVQEYDVGDHPIEIHATDREGDVAVQRFSLAVELNEPPVLTSDIPHDARLTAGHLFDHEFVFTDVNEDGLIIQLTRAPAGARVAPTSTTSTRVLWTPADDQVGNFEFLLEARDPSGAVTPINFTVTVYKNTPPHVAAMPEQQAQEGHRYYSRIEFADVDGDNMLYAKLQSGPAGMTFSSATNYLNWTPTADQLGLNEVVIVADDRHGGTTTVTFTIYVSPNNPPVITSQPPQQAVGGHIYTYVLSSTDADGDNVSYRFIDPPSGTSVFMSTARWTPPSDFSGPIELTIEAYDTAGGAARQTFTVNVAANSSPIFTSIPSNKVRIGGSRFDYRANATDADGDAISYKLESGPTGLAALGNLFYWYPQAGQGGVHSVTISADDRKGGKALQSFDILVYGDALRFIDVPAEQRLYLNEAYTARLVADQPDGLAITYALQNAPAGMVVDPLTGEVTWQPASGQAGVYNITATVSDAEGGFDSRVFTVIVLNEENTAPVFITDSLPVAFIGTTYSTAVVATDAQDHAIQYALTQAPANMVLDTDTGSLSWPAAEADRGEHAITVVATDERGLSTEKTFTLRVDDENHPPSVSFRPARFAAVGYEYTQRVPGVDIDGDILSYSVASGPTGLTIDALSGQVLWQPSPDQVGEHEVRIGVSDGQWIATTTWSITVAEQPLPLTVDISVSPQYALPGQEADIALNVRGGVSEYNLQLFVDGEPVVLNDRRATVSRTEVGPHAITAQVTDGYANTVERSTLYIIDEGDTESPVVQIHDIESQQTITAPHDLVISASDDNIDTVKLYYASAETHEEPWVLLYQGSSNLASQNVAAFDPTLLENGTYFIILEATDINGQTGQDVRAVVVEGNLKVGLFTITLKDLNFDLNGFPLQLTRTYDSRKKAESSDFGYGWSLGFQNIKLFETSEPTRGWTLSRESFATYWVNNSPVTLGGNCLRPKYEKMVSVTLPNGKVERFSVHAVPVQNTQESFTHPDCYMTLDRYFKLEFRPLDGATSKLQETGLNQYYLTVSENGNLTLDPASTNATPVERYTLTTKDGYRYGLDQAFGVVRIDDPAGEHIEFTQSGILHSSGKALTFERDDANRIKLVRDPSGSIAASYTYDARGDLVGHKNAYQLNESLSGSTYTYNNEHGLVDIFDPLGNKLVKNIYDESGRLVAQEDDAGNVMAFDHDIDGRQSTVTDRNLNTTVYYYDDRGNVLTQIDALGNRTDYTYDARDNQLSMTNALGHTESATYDAFDNQLTATDALGNTVSYTYTEFGREQTITDENGNRYDNTYHLGTQLASITDPQGNTAENIYLPGRYSIATMRDLLGNETHYTYDCVTCQKASETDPLGNVTAYTYDDNENLLSETRTREVNGLTQEETTWYTYDDDNRVIETEDPLGNVTRTEYDAAGNETATIDAMGRRTEMDYDPYGRLIATRYPDGVVERKRYDAEGNLVEETDRVGRVTSYTYDALNRLIETRYPGGAISRTGYDAAGRVVSETDARGNVTTYEYDAAGRRTAVEDALGNRHTFEYDPAGNLTAEVDANDHRTEYVYNSLNQRVETRFHDGSSVRDEVDALGRKTASIDQNGTRTEYGYDALGRLAEVRQFLDGESLATTYTYDSQGNKLTQTDAEGRTTRWEYDALGRVTTRILPLGQRETFTYDAVGNQLTHVDFNSQVTTSEYDNLNRLTRKTYDDGTVETWQYDDASRVTQASQTLSGATEVTTYAYDDRDRLIRETKPDGASITYGYDANGNRTSLTVTLASGQDIQVTYTYDALNRLETVADANGTTTYTYDSVGNRQSVTQANGVTTRYTYDSLNRLTELESTNSSNTVLTRFSYTLDPTGRRTAIEELNGRTSRYTYDDLYRLVSESITDPVNGNYSASYAYDKVGNRTASLIDGVQTAYTYDDNDRLLQQGGTTYTYDANGNTLSETQGVQVTRYSYDARNRMVGSETASGVAAYAYDIHGIRTARTHNGVTTTYVVDHNQQYAQVLAEQENGIATKAYTYGDDLLSQRYNGESSFFLYDGLGSTRALADISGSVSDEYFYEAFGQLLHGTGSTDNSYRFTGEQYDSALYQYYLRARYYDQGVGRFTQMDTWGGINNQPVTLNKYLYAHADPVLNTDPSGHFIGSLTTAQSIGAILAATAVATYQVGQVAATGGTWGDGIDPGPSSTGWLILAAMVGKNFSLLANIADKVNEDDTSTYTLYHGTDIATARLLAGGSPIDIDGAGCNWSVSCGGFYLADQLGDAEHFAVFTQSGVRDGGVVQYNFSAAAYQTIKGIATIQPLRSAPFFNPMGNEIIVPPSGFSVFNALMLKGDIEPGPVR